jgi:pimeloyl-ACP methyl ester carboxylesterase
MGGMIAQSLAARHPKLLRRLVLCATAPGDGHGTIPDPAALQELSNPTGGGGLLFPPGQNALMGDYIRDIAAYPDFMPQAPPDVSSLQFGASGTWLRRAGPVRPQPAPPQAARADRRRRARAQRDFMRPVQRFLAKPRL